MNKYSLVLLFSLFLFGCRSTKELNVSGFRIDLPFDKISLEPINDFGIFNYESEMKETMDNEVAIRPHYQIFIPMKGLKKIVETSTDWYFFYTHDRVIAIQQDLTKNYKTSERIKSSDGLGIRRISEDSVYYYSFSSECNKKLKNKGLPHYSYVDGEIIILMLNIPDRDYKYFVEYPLNSFRIKRRGGVRHRHDIPLICIMPPMPPDDEIPLPDQPTLPDEPIEYEFPCDVTATDYCGNFIYENGTLKRILIPGGYVTLLSEDIHQPRYHFYFTDHQGNVRVVVDLVLAIGYNYEEEMQINHYYPYGGLMGESTNSDVQPNKYNGKELDRTNGLDWYDYGARWYNGASWMTPDPLAEKYYDTSPYVYCMGNPVRYIDPNGEEPTEEEAARIAHHVYQKEKVKLIGGWKESSLSIGGVRFRNENSGFNSNLYERTVDGVTEYVYATAGTDFTSLKDWKNNFLQIVGQSEQYEMSMLNADNISKVLGEQELTFVGHSLGGGLAAANAYETGRSAMTFNAAWVSPLTIAPQNRKETKIDAFIHVRDELNLFQKNFGIGANGNRHWRSQNRSVLGHSIENFYRSDMELLQDDIKIVQEMYNNSPFKF